MSKPTADLNNKTIGFLGCGKISSCVVRGYCSAPGNQRPARILVSKRSEAKSSALAAEFPDLVKVVENEEVVSGSDVVFIGLLPAVAKEQLPLMPWGGSSSTKLVISMMAAVDIGVLRSYINIPHTQLVRTVPLPSCARRSGPILCHPVLQNCIDVLEIVGTPVACDKEEEMRPLVCLTGHISSFYQLMQTSEQFMLDNGVGAVPARTFVSAFYASMATATEASPHSLQEMAIEAATPGGINEQGLDILLDTEHFKNQTDSLEQVHQRLLGKVPYVKKERKA